MKTPEEKIHDDMGCVVILLVAVTVTLWVGFNIVNNRLKEIRDAMKPSSVVEEAKP